MIDILDKISCFVKRKNIFSLSTSATWHKEINCAPLLHSFSSHPHGGIFLLADKMAS
jgi:hypothetical protein